MKLARETKGIPSADLLVCFPSRSHLTLMPKPFCSPARPPDSNKLRVGRSHRHRRRKSTSAASPLVWARAKTMGSDISEPTSPKVTCAGQIKIRPKTSSCKSWQSVMEEIERIHNRRKLRRRRFNWVESFGFKKDVMQFLTCLRSIRFDFRCFRAFPESDFTTEEDEEEEEDEGDKAQENQAGVDGSEGSRTAFSKWFMVLQESHTTGLRRENRGESNSLCSVDDTSIGPPAAPPKNALLLMRCRSAPAKSWQEEKREEEEEEEEEESEDEEETEEEEEEKEVKVKKSLKRLMEEENNERLIMEMDADFRRMSSDIAKETWVVSEKSSRDTFSRSRSWKV